MKKYTEIQIWWLGCEAVKFNGKLDALTKEFNDTFGESRTKKSIETVMHKHGIRNRYFGSEQKEWLKENMKTCTWKELSERYNDIFGENRTRKSIICVCSRLGGTDGAD